MLYDYNPSWEECFVTSLLFYPYVSVSAVAEKQKQNNRYYEFQQANVYHLPLFYTLPVQ